MKNFLKNNGVMLFFLLLVPGIASANVAVPMFFLNLFSIGLIWILFVLIETKIIQKRLGVGGIDAFLSTETASFITMFFGFILSMLLTMGTLFFLSSKGPDIIAGGIRGSFEHIDSTYWTAVHSFYFMRDILLWNKNIFIFVSIIYSFYFIFSFFLSIWIKSFVYKKFFKNIEPQKIKKAVTMATTKTYMIMISLVFLHFIGYFFHNDSFPIIISNTIMYALLIAMIVILFLRELKEGTGK